jgi:nucleotide-binding universal stress UspA family protein
VLLCTDFSEAANAAIPYGVAMANDYAAELTILNVGLIFDQLLPSGVDEKSRKGIRDAVAEEALSRLDQIALPANAPRNTRRRFIWAPSAASGIIDFVERKAIDLVVLSSRGRQLIPGILLGSVARNVTAAAPCPVLCVRPPKERFSPERDASRFRARRILVPTDGSERSLEAISHAASLATRHAGDLTVVHVVAVDLWVAGLSFGISELLKGSDSEVKATLKERVTSVAKSFEDEGGKLSIMFKEGRPSEEIAYFAKTHGTDLIVMSRKGRRKTEHRLGGVPERLLRDAPCPVLLV